MSDDDDFNPIMEKEINGHEFEIMIAKDETDTVVMATIGCITCGEVVGGALATEGDRDLVITLDNYAFAHVLKESSDEA